MPLRFKKYIGDALVSGFLLLIFALGGFSFLDHRLQDLFFQRRPPIHPDIIIIGIDEYTIAELGMPAEWSRQIMADAINILNSDPLSKPAVIALDILYTVERGELDADQSLAMAAKNGDNVVVAANAVTRNVQNPANPSQTMRTVAAFEKPFPALREHVRYGNVNNIILDQDSAARRTDFWFAHEGEIMFSFPFEIYRQYVGDAFVAFEPKEIENLYITYHDRPGSYKQFSFVDIFSADFEPAFFAGSIVMIGAYAPGLMDAYHTPVHNELMHGVEIQANITQMLLEENFKFYVHSGVNFAILLFIIALSIAFAHFLDLRFTLAAYAGLIFTYYIFAWFLFEFGYLITLAYPLFAVALICVCQLVYNYMIKAIKIAELENELLQGKISIMLSQIRPHFLYNSLVAIQELCLIDPEEASETVADFSNYLRHNVNSLSINSPVPFEKELRHVETYLSLEQKRFGKKVEAVYEILAWDFVLPALTVQPVVENAVRHGITMRCEGGKIVIRSEEKNGCVVITVTDNGVGFDTKAAGGEGERIHTGIENVRGRLAAMCGGDLTIISEIGAGTTATITIPRMEA